MGRKKSYHKWQVTVPWAPDEDMEKLIKTDECKRCGLIRWSMKDIGVARLHGRVYAYYRRDIPESPTYEFTQDFDPEFGEPLCIVCITQIQEE